ncbi:hypothetical protein [Rhizobium leguminosarum]|uniref:hypothetical protein n=1 Tax=Rhizobium leguminosarum TaxID=384 RepID=UPI0013F17C5C|nr:hypothetical protein [Rhizobium leguminosarum]MBY5485361.1 hypothetical protein [Rhizobium leguminosarum]
MSNDIAVSATGAVILRRAARLVGTVEGLGEAGEAFSAALGCSSPDRLFRELILGGVDRAPSSHANGKPGSHRLFPASFPR